MSAPNLPLILWQLAVLLVLALLITTLRRRIRQGITGWKGVPADCLETLRQLRDRLFQNKP